MGTLDDLRGLASRIERAGAMRGKGAARLDPQVLVAEAFGRLAARAERTVVVRRAAGEEERLRELLPKRGLAFLDGSLSRSFLFGPTKTAYVAYDDLADLSIHERRPPQSLPASRPIQDFLELEVGEAVVHLHHGIGVFRGLASSAEAPGGAKGAAPASQTLKIEFAEGTTLFVPVNPASDPHGDLVCRVLARAHQLAIVRHVL